MIYDCFLYNGEKDLLEIRVNETKLIKSEVTTVIIEANVTHTGEKKELYFEKYKDDFNKFNIFYFIVDDMPIGSTPKEMEKFQRNQIKRVLKFCEPKIEDGIIISDVDEIPRARTINEILENNIKFCALIQDKYNYYLNYLEGMQIWDRARWMTWGYLRGKQPEEVRNSGYTFSAHHAGWHYSWVGGPDEAERKLKSFSHQELNTPYNRIRVRDGLNIWGTSSFEKTEIDLSHPEYLFRNKEKFKHLIL